MKNELKSRILIFIVAFFAHISCFSQAGNSFEITLISPTFPNGVSNQAVNIQFPNVAMWGWIEVTITSSFSHELATGKLTKRYELGNNVGGFFAQKTEIPAAFGNVANQWHIGDFNQSNNSITIYHLVSTQNVLTIQVKGMMAFTDNIDLLRTGTTISDMQSIPPPSGRQYMSIMQDRVGIGTMNPDSALAVNGTIHSKEVKVDTNIWPDFVFKKEYDLPKLEEVEKYIAQKGHLENIPSEEEVLKNGINLGEMNAKLLQKIEELTLHVIDLNKKVNSLQDDNRKIKKENRVMVEKVESIERKRKLI